MVAVRRSTRIANSKRKLEADEAERDVASKSGEETTSSKKLKKEKDVRVTKVDDKESKAENKPSGIKEVEIGDEIPDLELENQDGVKISLRQLAKDNNILVFFAYPRAMTPGCTRQACGFRDTYDDLKKHAAVFGLSADSTHSQKKFQDKYSLPYDLLSDPKREFIGLLGAKKTPQSGIIRSHFIFVDGKLRFKRIKISPEISVNDGKKEVLEIVEEFSK
ncbi:hypothetical protein Kpol_1062p57 [Vanderwaltozyma polyspora DSM 70294]|uniref:thioredoxin-dependent peroxiredoxin n=1 Tax=Vanderwaltozyma polyspora (strain ATCC 22028 / DSM 70294 / BCRC 21397 / CBS 2163 / NBRC 10782 / NRRL Y-8283 / UCD 57-17) TaxID=436907 RepID=A7TKB1_VANPO|nr:uncharacterized protein Kpol_1062p57 [Vanderwaltozyma polyspora DSM 70294]EDO17346.1 hypothetical protein Kpol_1062p57 [Vanderwaltozyma polyspora DSM 70294]